MFIKIRMVKLFKKKLLFIVCRGEETNLLLVNIRS